MTKISEDRDALGSLMLQSSYMTDDTRYVMTCHDNIVSRNGDIDLNSSPLGYLRFFFDRSGLVYRPPTTPLYRKIAAFIDYLDEQEISYMFVYDDVRWTGQRWDGATGTFLRKLCLVCVPDPNDRVLLRLRFDCLPLSDCQDIRGPWIPRLAHATVELHD